MLKIIRLIIFTAIFITGCLSSVIQAEGPHVLVLEVKGSVNPVLSDYIKNGIIQAEKSGASACIIQIDTPGGLDTAMRDICQSILNAKVPVVVYVYPPGARAASAGVFVTMSAHVAAMADDTAIGAAHPVSIGDSGEQQMSSEMTEKVVNDAAAYIRGIAESKGRNADWAEKAVRESVSATAAEALDLKIVDVVAPDLDDLLARIDGREIKMMDGSTVILHTKEVNVQYQKMGWITGFLYTIADSNIAYILLSIGSLGILAEIFNPGMIFPGVVGGICLLLAFYGLGVLSVNWAGVLLILLAFGLFVAEFFTPGFGLLFGGGIVSFIIGSLILFKGGSPVYQINWWLIAIVIIIMGGFVAFAATRVVHTYRRQATTGREDLIGKAALVKEALSPEGTVIFQGELWTAQSVSGNIEIGEEVIISRVDGLKLIVTKKEKE
jgi:membrane-bound serine protease (ClpP class)